MGSLNITAVIMCSMKRWEEKEYVENWQPAPNHVFLEVNPIYSNEIDFKVNVLNIANVAVQVMLGYTKGRLISHVPFWGGRVLAHRKLSQVYNFLR